MKITIIGAGSMAEEHIRAFVAMDSVDVVGIYSRTHSKSVTLSEKYSIPYVCDSVSELYNTTKADAVIIAVSETSTKQICYEAFKFPWVALVEKPMGYNLEEAADITGEAQRTGSRVFVALNRRQYSSTKNVLEDLKGSNQTRLIHVMDQQDSRSATLAGRPEKVVKNWMYANSIHLVDYFNVLGRGHITSVERLVKWTADIPGFVIAKINFSSGDIGIYEAIWNGPGPWAVVVTTQDKRWELRPLEKAAFQVYGSRQLQPIDLAEVDSTFKAGFYSQAEELLKALQGLPHTLVSAEEALRSMKLVSEIYG
jgi:predicted dehydrogenase